MSTNTVTHDADAATSNRLAALEERLERLENENERLREELADEREKRADLEDRLESTNQRLTFAEDRINESQDRLDEHESFLEDVVPDDVLSDLTPDENEVEDEDGPSPLERVLSWEYEVARDELSPNQMRARLVASSLSDLSTRTPKGAKLTSLDVRKCLSARNEPTHNETVNRTMDYLADLARDDLETDTVRRGRRCLYFAQGVPDRYRDSSRRDVTRLRANRGDTA